MNVARRLVSPLLSFGAGFAAVTYKEQIVQGAVKAAQAFSAFAQKAPSFITGVSALKAGGFTAVVTLLANTLEHKMNYETTLVKNEFLEKKEPKYTARFARPLAFGVTKVIAYATAGAFTYGATLAVSTGLAYAGVVVAPLAIPAAAFLTAGSCVLEGLRQDFVSSVSKKQII